MRRPFAPLLLLAALAAVTACTSSPARAPSVPAPTTPVTRSVHWTPVTLPAPPAGLRTVVRASATCPGHWYLTGALVDAGGAQSPAAWSSTDGHTFAPVRVAAHSFYGKQNTVTIAGCRDGVLAAIGAKTGGVHGFNRYSTWFPDATGTLTEMDVPYTLFAGPEGVNVSRVAVGPRGFAYAGNRTSGAAAWVSPTGRTLDLVERAPGLASDADRRTWAADVTATPTGWLIVGAVTSVADANRDPGVWTSADGRAWVQVPVPGTPAFEDPQRVVVAGSSVVMIGPRATGYGVWRSGADGVWSLVAGVGSNGSGAGGATALVAVGGHLFATVSDATAYHLYVSDDIGSTWAAVDLPAAAPARVDTYVAVFTDGHTLMVVVDDGAGSRIWLGDGVTAGG